MRSDRLNTREDDQNYTFPRNLKIVSLTPPQKLAQKDRAAQSTIEAILVISLSNVELNTPLTPRTGHLECEVCRIGHLQMAQY